MEDRNENVSIGYVCAGCGEEIDRRYARRADTEWHKTGYLPYCVRCQQKRFSYWRRQMGDKRTLALYLSCLMFDVPYLPEIVEITKSGKDGIWIAYLANLRKAKKNRTGDRPANFLDGVSDMAVALGEEMPQAPVDGDFGMSQRESWNRKWGADMSEAACTHMDSMYEVISAEYKGSISPRLDLAIRDICKLRYLRDESLQKDSGEAKRYQEMIDKIMSSEAMKVGDAKPTEAIRVDALADALEKRGVLTDGRFSMKGVLNYIAQDKGAYIETLDIVDAIMLKMINANRTNLGESEFSQLPKDLRVNDVFKELQGKPTSKQAQDMKKLDVVPSRKTGKR